MSFLQVYMRSRYLLLTNQITVFVKTRIIASEPIIMLSEVLVETGSLSTTESVKLIDGAEFETHN